MSSLQVLVEIPEHHPLVAGLPAALRSAKAVQELSPQRTVFAGHDPSFSKRWRRQLAGFKGSFLSADGQPPAQSLNPALPLLVVSGDGFAPSGSFKRFQNAVKTHPRPTRWLYNGKPVAAYYPDSDKLLTRAGATADSVARQALTAPSEIYRSAEGDWRPTSDQKALLSAEEELFAELPQDSDGYLARFDRKLSMTLSRRLIRTSVLPNHITTLSLILGLLGAALLVRGPYAMEVFGALLLWSGCILDGCDGEVARLKFLATPAGGLYDVIADNIVHLAVFIAIPLHLRRVHPEMEFLIPGIVLVSGVLACTFSVWWLVLSRPKSTRGSIGLLVERIASRDFLYLILALTLARKLEWFLWCAGVGSHAFNAALWTVFLRKRPKT